MSGANLEVWKRIASMPPPHSGYYRVQDTEGRQGIAFMYRNHEWKLVEGHAQKPLDLWNEIS